MTTTAQPVIHLVRAGTLPYATALQWQRDLVAARSAGRIPDTLLLLEHPPTITLGARADPAHVLLSPDELQRRGVAVVASDRGGDVTYHGPGQLVGYPILKLSHYGADLGRYLRGLEETIIRTLADYGVPGERAPGLTGVWVAGGRAKICAIGVRLSASGVTSHGFALNVSTDLSGFAQIVPCGIADRAVTSLERLLGYAPSLDAVSTTLVGHFAAVFGVEIRTEDGVQWERERPVDGKAVGQARGLPYDPPRERR